MSGGVWVSYGNRGCGYPHPGPVATTLSPPGPWP